MVNVLVGFRALVHVRTALRNIASCNAVVQLTSLTISCLTLLFRIKQREALYCDFEMDWRS